MARGYRLFVFCEVNTLLFFFLEQGSLSTIWENFHFTCELTFEFLKNHVTIGWFKREVSLFSLKHCQLCQKRKSVQTSFLKNFQNVWETGFTWSNKKPTIFLKISYRMITIMLFIPLFIKQLLTLQTFAKVGLLCSVMYPDIG